MLTVVQQMFNQLVISSRRTLVFLLFSLALSAHICASQTVNGPPIRLTRIGTIPLGPSLVKGKMALFEHGQRKLLCFGAGENLYVYDVTNPAKPDQLLKKDFAGDAVHGDNDVFEVIRSGSYLVLAGSYRAGGNPPEGQSPRQVGFVQLLDITAEDPADWKPPKGGTSGRWVSYWEDEHSWTASDVALEGKVGQPGCYLHISGNLRPCDHLGGCLILDLSDPATPAKRGVIRWEKDGNYMGHGVTFDGRYQYHGNYYRGIYIVDYANPDQLSVAASTDYPGRRDSTRSLIKIGKYLYATVTVGPKKYYVESNAGVATFDVSDPTDPKLVSQTPVPQKDRPSTDEIAHDSPPHKIHSFMDGKVLLINMGAKGIAAFSIDDDPANPVYLGLIPMDHVPPGTRPFIWDDELFVIGDGPNFIGAETRNTDNHVHLFRWQPFSRVPKPGR
jgi:hypothetical protein